MIVRQHAQPKYICAGIKAQLLCLGLRAKLPSGTTPRSLQTVRATAFGCASMTADATAMTCAEATASRPLDTAKVPEASIELAVGCPET